MVKIYVVDHSEIEGEVILWSAEESLDRQVKE